MKEKIGVYAGSFDPFTNGHLAVVKKAAEILDYVIVVIGVNADKKRRFSIEDMRLAIFDTLHNEGIHNVSVDFTEDLIAIYAKNQGASYLTKTGRTLPLL